MKQLTLFSEGKEHKEKKEHKVIKPRKRVLPVVEDAKCDMEDLSPCIGKLYRHGVSDKFRCARHITLQKLWYSGRPTNDLDVWIKEHHETISMQVIIVTGEWYENQGD